MTVGSITAHSWSATGFAGLDEPLAPPRDYLLEQRRPQFLEARRRVVADRNAGEEHHLDRTRGRAA